MTANPGLLASAVLTRIARTHQRTPAQTLFRYLSQEDAVPLTGTRSIVHMVQDLAIFEFTLDDGERAEIGGLLQ